MHPRHLLAAGLAAAALAVPLAGTAAAHVTVQAPGATRGGFTKLTFRMPTERDVATTKLEVVFPADQPLAFVNVKPHPGWRYQVVKAAPPRPFEAFGEPVTEVVTRIVWTATGEGVAPGEFDEFEVSAGPLPDAERMTFRALQTYADGEVVRWIEPPASGGREPEHPAPVLTLAAPQPTASAPTTPVAATDGGTDPLVLAALGIAVFGLALGMFAAVRAGRSGQPRA